MVGVWFLILFVFLKIVRWNLRTCLLWSLALKVWTSVPVCWAGRGFRPTRRGLLFKLHLGMQFELLDSEVYLLMVYYIIFFFYNMFWTLIWRSCRCSPDWFLICISRLCISIYYVIIIFLFLFLFLFCFIFCVLVNSFASWWKFINSEQIPSSCSDFRWNLYILIAPYLSVGSA